MILSVVIPTFNKQPLLRRTLEALIDQILTGDPAWEIVVVNDGSTDGTADFLADLEARRSGRVPAVRTVRPGTNVGRARARNLGAEAARGTYLLFLDDDIVAPAGLVQAHLDVLTAGTSVGTIGYAVTDPEVVDAPHFHYLDTRGVARLGRGPAPGRFFVTQNAAVPRAAFAAVGGFDEAFQAYGFEDMELAFRLEDKTQVAFQALTGPVPVHVHHHSLAQYWNKKRECGRHTLPRIARLHPHRVAEMRLDLVFDRGVRGRLLNIWSRSGAGRRFPEWLGGWPVGAGHRPRMAGLYFRLMNLAVLTCFCQGLADSSEAV